jgi:formylglycine-generating enzyme required for sulfatase activity/actin-like ATPase involved in cell morphogenesis
MSQQHKPLCGGCSMAKDTPFLGIDFGTSQSSMAWFNPRTNQAEVLRNAEGEEKTPSVVYYGDGETLVGKPAEDLLENEHERGRILFSVKRDLAKRVRYSLGDRYLRPVEVVADILRKLKRDAEEGHFGEPVGRAVITHPAVFDQEEKGLLEEAAKVAGFTDVVLLPEPVAAAVAYAEAGLNVGDSVLVYDLGGGTFDLALLNRGAAAEAFSLAAEPRGLRCGGDDFDLALYDHCETIAQRTLKRGIGMIGRRDLQFLRECRRRKENLSQSTRSKFSSYLRGGVRFEHAIDRESFEKLIGSAVKPTIILTRSMLDEATSEGWQPKSVVLIGGSSRVPLVQQLLREAMPIEPVKWERRDVAVALGAAYHGRTLWRAKASACNMERSAPEISPRWSELTGQRMTNHVGARIFTPVGKYFGMKLVLLPAGKFLMGSPENETGRYQNEGPQHEVEITKPFFMGIHTVTVGQFRQFIEDSRYQTTAETDNEGGRGYDSRTGQFCRKPGYTWKYPGWEQDEDYHPVVNISWNDAVTFCQWLSKREGKAYRLPTEAEWEYACRAGTTTRYWFGHDEQGLEAAANISDASLKEALASNYCKFGGFQAWNDRVPFTAPVESFKQNPWALYHMHGNVWEWCQDRFDEDYYTNGPTRDPQGPDRGNSHVVRGGSFASHWQNCRAACRRMPNPMDFDYFVGFRVVHPPEPAELDKMLQDLQLRGTNAQAGRQGYARGVAECQTDRVPQMSAVRIVYTGFPDAIMDADIVVNFDNRSVGGGTLKNGFAIELAASSGVHELRLITRTPLGTKLGLMTVLGAFGGMPSLTLAALLRNPTSELTIELPDVGKYLIKIQSSLAGFSATVVLLP